MKQDMKQDLNSIHIFLFLIVFALFFTYEKVLADCSSYQEKYKCRASGQNQGAPCECPKEPPIITNQVPFCPQLEGVRIPCMNAYKPQFCSYDVTVCTDPGLPGGDGGGFPSDPGPIPAPPGGGGSGGPPPAPPGPG